MHKERIIAGIEKVFEGYGGDTELIEALRESGSPLKLFPTHDKLDYCLFANGKIISSYKEGYPLPSSPREAAEGYFQYLCFKGKRPLTLTKAKKMLEDDLGKRVEELKRAYARHFENECDRIDEERYTHVS
ncbi:hypothetical protein HZC32_02050 [Candidatus Woesearchaeota archaeon]|nr:hypothetical protein [Candidatus Woesearchaeota archaeon]